MRIDEWLDRYVTLAALSAEFEARSWVRGLDGAWRKGARRERVAADGYQRAARNIVGVIASEAGLPASAVWASLLKRCPGCPQRLTDLVACWAALDEDREVGRA